MRFTIAGLMTAILCIGIGFVALHGPEPWLWETAILSLTVIVIGTATLTAVAKKGPHKMAWAGFAIFGFTYIFINFMLHREIGVVPVPFMTTVLRELAQAYKDLRGLPLVRVETFVVIGHSLFAVLFGLAGASLGENFSRRNAAASGPD